AHRRAPVAAHEGASQLAEQGAEGLAQQRGAGARVQRHIVVGRLEPLDIGHLHHARRAAFAHQQLARGGWAAAMPPALAPPGARAAVRAPGAGVPGRRA
ncbi:hypothetical protein LTR94_033224, partial [Friedmanniomyces endolithicus]